MIHIWKGMHTLATNISARRHHMIRRRSGQFPRDLQTSRQNNKVIIHFPNKLIQSPVKLPQYT